MLSQTTPVLNLPLPNAANKLEEDLPRLVAALGILDTQFGAIHTLLGSDDTTLDQLQELVNAIKDNRSTIAALMADMATKEQLAAVSAAVTAVGAAAATVLDLQNLSSTVGPEIAALQASSPISGLSATADANGNLPGTVAFRLPPGMQGQYYLLEPYGLYMFQGAATDPADGQTCILPASGAGRWMLICPTWDFSFTWLQLDFPMAKSLVGSASLDFPSIAAGSSATLAINVNGAMVGETTIIVAPTTFPGQVVLRGSVTQPGIVSVVATNNSTGAVDPAAATITAIIFRT